MKNNIKNLILLSGFILLIPSLVKAHVKWFAEEQITYHQPYSLNDPNILTISIVAFLIILLGIFLEHKIKVSNKTKNIIEKITPIVISVANIMFGFALIIFSYSGFIFAPNLSSFDIQTQIMLFIQLMAGIMILAGFYEKIGGLLIVFLFFISNLKFGFLEMIDALEIFAFAIYIFIVGRPKWKLFESNFINTITHKINHYAYPLLKIGTGINLLVLGFSEKILAPNLAQNFLNTYDWNFMQKLGFINYTDYYFIFSAGVVEALFGIFLILGLVTRITTFVLALFLITTLMLLGPVELIGHLPHFAIAIIFLTLGKGSRMIIGKKD